MNDRPPGGQTGTGPALNIMPLWTKNFVRIWIFNLLICVWFFMQGAPFSFYIIELGG